MNREDFPFFKNNNSVHLDSASTSQLPFIVLDKINQYYTNYKSNIDRGLYKDSETVTSMYENVRVKVADFISVNSEDVIFTPSSTYSSNLLTHIIEQNLLKKYLASDLSNKNIITSIYEHNSIAVPLIELSNKYNIKLIYIDSVDKILEECNQDTIIVNYTKASNVTGEINYFENIFKFIKDKYNVFTICDYTCFVGHDCVDSNEVKYIDAMFFSGHKMCAGSGVGVLMCRRDLTRNIKPQIVGGGVISSVDYNSVEYRSDVKVFEAGTQNIPSVLSLGYAIDYLNSIGIKNIREYIKDLNNYTYEKLSSIKNIKLYGIEENNIGVFSFEYRTGDKFIHAHDVAQVLANNNVSVRSGHHCASILMKELNVTSLTRVSLYFYNTRQDIDNLCEALLKVDGVFK